jgi:hypothetical protein
VACDLEVARIGPLHRGAAVIAGAEPAGLEGTMEIDNGLLPTFITVGG